MPAPIIHHRILALVAALALTLPCTVQAGDNPGYDRPGLGFTPAVLHAGDITWEQGLPDWSRASSASTSQYTADALLRVGLGGPLELQLGGSYNRLEPGGQDGRGDTTVGLKFALPAHDALSWGLLGSVEFTDGSRAFRSHRRQYLLGADLNWQLDSGNALGAYLQDVRGGGRDSQLLAVSASRALSANWNGYVEVAGEHDPQAGGGSMAGAGLAWQATPRVQLDGSFRHRLAGHADRWEAGLGVSVYFGR